MKRSSVLRIVLLFWAVAATAGAQESEPAYERFNHGIGFSAGQISGVGLSYRYWFSEKVGIQACAGALYMPLNPGLSWSWPGRLLDYWAGAEVFRSLYATEFTRWLFGQVYLFAGLSHFGYIPWSEILGTETDPEGRTYEVILGYEPGAYVPGLGLGGGVGIEATLFAHFSAAFELGYALFWEANAAALPDQLRVELVPQGMFQFRY